MTPAEPSRVVHRRSFAARRDRGSRGLRTYRETLDYKPTGDGGDRSIVGFHVEAIDGGIDKIGISARAACRCELILAADVGVVVGDVGCGTGRLAPYLAARGVSPRGIDLSSEMVRVARRDYPDVVFDVADLRDLPFEDASMERADKQAPELHGVITCPRRQPNP